jgi:glycosyltransferase XagB
VYPGATQETPYDTAHGNGHAPELGREAVRDVALGASATDGIAAEVAGAVAVRRGQLAELRDTLLRTRELYRDATGGYVAPPAPVAPTAPEPSPTAVPPSAPGEVEKIGAVVPIGRALLNEGLIDEATLEWALARQRETGERLGNVLQTAGMVHRLDLQHALGRQWGLPFLDLLENPPDTALARACDPERLLAEGWIPVRHGGDRVIVATSEPPSGELRAAIQEELGAQAAIELHTTTPLDIERAVTDAFREHLVARSTVDLLNKHPELSAAGGWSRGQKVVAIVTLLLALVGTVIDWGVTLSAFIVFANFVFLAAVSFKLLACVAGFRARLQTWSGREFDDRRLPIYTILVPIYGEANIVGDLIANLAAIDYPQEKLEVLVLLEEDDVETIEAAKAARPPSNFRLVIVPHATPKTKPRACNVGLILARGEFLVIYDAEDRPDPDQLRKAVAAFRDTDEKTVCVQARLRYWNGATNFLTRMFALEYGYWFGIMLPGLDRLHLPIPLGGTSNHFRVEALRRLGGWDPHNVTEDADLGLRAAVEGLRVGVIDSATDEEACSKLRPWIRQRTRWIKGYMQTALVHTRSPRHLVKQVGVVDAIGFLLLIAGTPLTFLLAPPLWLGTASWYAFGEPNLPLVDSGVFWGIAVFNLLVGNAIMIGLNLLGAIRDRGWREAPFALLNPIYWVLHSWAAWRALIQLVHKPYYWEKTPHGLDSGGEAAAQPAAP